MPLEKTQNISPYFDDYTSNSNYYKVLFKPGVSVQARELNQLQTLLQAQVERFGDNIFKSGTILSGINFSYLPNYSYIKITDSQIDGQPVIPSGYVDYFVKSDLNLTARIVNSYAGLESKAPDLNTLYLQYVSSSNTDTANGNAVYTQFAPGQILTVFDQNYPLFHIDVNGGGKGFANSDTVVISSAIIVSGNTAAFTNGEILTSSSTGLPSVTISSINTTAIANTTIIGVKPTTSDLTNPAKNANNWTLVAGYNVVGSSSGATANIVSLIGSGATALATTDSLGIVQTVTFSNSGQNYTYPPFVTIKSANTVADLSTLSLTPLNYKTKITVANAAVNAVGVGYAFGISGGVIYQKGFFLQVAPQVVLVSKYDTNPTGIVAGLETTESFVTALADESLYDNASNTTNYAAPGADRLNLTPILVTHESSTTGANAQFLALAEWNEGEPFRENKTTVYSNIGDEMARRTREAQGNFVIDPFEISTKERATANGTYIQAVVDPGLSYISGYRVSADYNTYLDVPRATTTLSQTGQSKTVNYGNYVFIKELAGLFNFKAGATVTFYDTAKAAITNSVIPTGTTFTPAGNAIGTARMRSLVLDTGNPGTPSCTYRLYLFDVQMNAGYSFRNVKGMYYTDGTNGGIADVVQITDPTSNVPIGVLNDTIIDQMMFPLGQNAIQAVTNVSHQYRTSSDTTLQISTSGQLSIGPLGTGLTFPYSDGVISSVEERDFIILPIANSQATANIAGSISFTATSNSTVVSTVAVGTGTAFATALSVGDFVKIANTAAANTVRQVVSIANNTYMTLSTNGANSTITSANAILFYPAMYPLSLESRSGRTIIISGSSKTATLSLGVSTNTTVNAIATYSVKKTNATPLTKTINRDLFVKLHTSNNVGGSTGPWSLGIPGIARLKKVYQGSNTTVNTASTDITKYFYINVGDDENAYRNGQLVLANKTGITLTANQFILVQFDAFTTSGSGGFFNIGSYSINDTANLDSSAATINTLEIPETKTKKGYYYDLRDTIDFRPYGANTANLSATVAGATVNPSNTFSITATDQFFPTPDSTVTYDVSYYLPRKDTVTVDTNASFKYIVGVPALTPQAPPASSTSLSLGTVLVPPYPSLPSVLNAQTRRFASKQVGNDRSIYTSRVSNYTVSTSFDTQSTQQPRRYTMADIGAIDKRLETVENKLIFNDIEKSIVSKVIPSGVTPTLNRFKNAYFVEPFDDFSRSATTNREYACSIDLQNSVMKPLTQQLNFECMFDTSDLATGTSVIGQTLMLPYTQQTFIDQSIKSDVVGVDGHAVQFVGTAAVSPSSFSLLAQVVVTPDPPVIVTYVPGVPSYYGGGGSRYGDRTGTQGGDPTPTTPTTQPSMNGSYQFGRSSDPD